ncbi:PilN domain-containing protein [Hydrogenophaga sp. OTU3427]|uniref:PilN domain-containing protein n=1 Tax=Hydrogenophaga sp. OTU3427 TaxID=3043856 RepID=UPI00313E2BF8
MIQNQARLFGLDLSAAASDWRAAWSGLWHGPWRRWLTPATTVRLLLPDGTDAVWTGPARPLQARPDAKALARARFVGVVLPDDVLLRRQWTLPPLAEATRQSAIELELRGISPFPATDTLAVHATEAVAGGKLQVHAALVSRPHVAQYLAEQAPRLGKVADPEVWVPLGAQREHWRQLPGFGGGRRERAGTVWAALAALVLLACLAVGAGIALTPTLQLRERALQAQQNFAELQAKAAPAMQHREALVRNAGMLDAVNGIATQRLPALQVLDLVTRWLPDGTFLTNFQLEGLKVRLAGQTDNAANLMRQLGSQPGLVDVKAPTAAVKVPGLNKETFTIEFSLDPKPLQVAPQ